MEKIKINSILVMLIVVYSLVILIVLGRIVVLSLKPPAVIQAPEIVQLNVQLVEKTFSQINQRSENRFPGFLDLNQFEFGRDDPFQ